LDRSGSKKGSSVLALKPDAVWNVIYRDDGAWRAGIYRPAASFAGEITELEKHSHPELFVCMEGPAGLVIDDGAGEREIVLSPGESLLVSGYHSGFRASEHGFFLVIERTDFTTEYIDRLTKSHLRSVRVPSSENKN